MSSDHMPLKPLTLPVALLYFGIPAAVFVFSVYDVIPFLIAQGFTEYMSYALALLLPLIAMVIASLLALRMEGYPVNWISIRQRFRFRKMDRTDWLWTGISLVVMFIGTGLFGALGQLLLTWGLIPLPAKIPTILLDPTVTSVNLMTLWRTALGPDAAGNWGLVFFTIILLVFNIFGEEIWWRGVILPRQELVHGKYTWFIHGTLWTLFHAFKYWSWLGLWPVCLTLSYVAQRRKNTWPGVMTHFIFNSGLLFAVLAVVLGK